MEVAIDATVLTVGMNNVVEFDMYFTIGTHWASQLKCFMGKLENLSQTIYFL